MDRQWGSQPTYEELKPHIPNFITNSILSSQPTYEELKHTYNASFSVQQD